MKLINGVKHYNTTDVAIFCGKSAQSIALWDKYSDQLEAEGQERLIPKPIKVGNWKIKTNFEHSNEEMEVKGRRFWNEDQLQEIITFSNNLKRGDLARFSREKWGKRGEEMKEKKKRKQEEKLKAKAPKPLSKEEVEEQRYLNRLNQFR